MSLINCQSVEFGTCLVHTAQIVLVRHFLVSTWQGAERRATGRRHVLSGLCEITVAAEDPLSDVKGNAKSNH
jgi:hypothetical protein